jgi:hypothetical protein
MRPHTQTLKIPLVVFENILLTFLCRKRYQKVGLRRNCVRHGVSVCLIHGHTWVHHCPSTGLYMKGYTKIITNRFFFAFELMREVVVCVCGGGGGERLGLCKTAVPLMGPLAILRMTDKLLAVIRVYHHHHHHYISVM